MTAAVLPRPRPVSRSRALHAAVLGTIAALLLALDPPAALAQRPERPERTRRPAATEPIPVPAARSGLPPVAAVAEWAEEHGLRLERAGRIDGVRWWKASLPGLHLELSGTPQVVQRITLQTDTSATGASPDVLDRLSDAWIERFAGEAQRFHALLRLHPPKDGIEVARQLQLGDRILQGWSQHGGDVVTLTIRRLDQRILVALDTDLAEPCREQDPATGQAGDALTVELAATLRAGPDAAPGRVWLFMAEPAHTEGVAQLLRASWPDPIAGVDPDSGDLLVVGPLIRPGQTLDLAWAIRYDDARDHLLEARVVVAPDEPMPLAPDAATRLRDTPAIRTWPTRFLASVPCPGLPGAPLPGIPEAREHITDAIERLWAVNDAIAASMRDGASIDDQLETMQGVEVWAVREKEWLAAMDPFALAGSPALRDYRAVVAAMRVLARQVVDTRGYDPTEVRSVLELLGHTLQVLDRRIATELVGP